MYQIPNTWCRKLTFKSVIFIIIIMSYSCSELFILKSVGSTRLKWNLFLSPQRLGHLGSNLLTALGVCLQLSGQRHVWVNLHAKVTPEPFICMFCHSMYKVHNLTQLHVRRFEPQRAIHPVHFTMHSTLNILTCPAHAYFYPYIYLLSTSLHIQGSQHKRLVTSLLGRTYGNVWQKMRLKAQEWTRTF